MLRLWLRISTRWLTIFTLSFFCLVLGLIDNNKTEQLFLRNTSEIYSREDSVKGSPTEATRNKYINSQIKEIAVDAKILPTATPLRPAEQSSEGQEWGISKQIDEHTWTIKVGEDSKNATAQEILIALNNYRQRNGRGALSWDDGLANYANSRASYFGSIGKLDSHAGFSDYVNNQDGFHKLGFMSLGENSSFGYTLEGVHLIEWVYAGDKPHDDNQLSSDWSHVGIGVNGTATDLIFGGKKM